MSYKHLVEVVNNLKETSPILIMGEAYYVFKKAWKDKIIYLDNENIIDIVSYYSVVKTDYPLVFEDISYLRPQAVNYLLKLVEESKTPLILLASVDNINEILLSRIKSKIKVVKPVSSEFRTPKEGLDIIEESLSKDSAFYDVVRYQAKYSPYLYYLESNLKNVSNSRKIIEILS